MSPMASGIATAAACAAFIGILCEAAGRGAARHGLSRSLPPHSYVVSTAACLPIAMQGNITFLPVALAVGGAAVSGFADAVTGYVFDELSGLMLCGVLSAALFVGRLQAAAIGSGVTILVLSSLYAATRGRGLGLGDVKLGATIGAGLGPTHGLASIGLAFACGGAYGALLLLLRRARRDSEIRFAPFLGIGAIALGYRLCFQ